MSLHSTYKTAVYIQFLVLVYLYSVWRLSLVTCQQDSLLCRSAADVDHGVEEIRSALAALEGFADEFVVVGEVSSAVDTGVGSVAVRQILSERL